MAFFGCILCCRLVQASTTEHFFEIGGGLATLRTVCLVDDDSTPPCWKHSCPVYPALFGHSEQLARDERKFLLSGDDHRHRVFQCLRELARTLIDPLHDAAFVLELV